MWARKRYLLLGGVAFVLTTAILTLPTRFIPPAPGDVLQTIGIATHESIEFPIDVLVWNIAKGGSDDFESGYRQLSHGKSLFLIQEYHDNSAVGRAMFGPSDEALAVSREDEIAPQFKIGTSFLFRFDSSRTGVATGCFAEPISSQAFTSRFREPIARTPKATLVTEYRIAECSESLLIVNIHGINVAGFDALRDQMNHVLPVVESHAGPIIFGGDFNTNTKAKLEFVLEFMERLGLTETVFDNDQRMTAPFGKIPLDYVFARGLKIEAAEVKGAVKGSDHKAIVLTIRGVSRKP